MEKFGEETLDIIENNPERLAEIRGISHAKAMNINAEYQKQFGLKDIMMLLSPFGVTPDEALKIFKKHHKNERNSVLISNGLYLNIFSADTGFRSSMSVSYHFPSGSNISAEFPVDSNNRTITPVPSSDNFTFPPMTLVPSVAGS